MTESESLLKESDEKYQFLINSILDVIAEIDLDGTFTYISPRVYDMFGYLPEEVIGNQFFSYIHPDDMELVFQTFQRVKEGEEQFSREYRFRHKKGHYVYVFAKGSLVKINNKTKIIGVLRDVTEFKEGEQKLKKSEENYRLLFNQIPDFIYVTDTDGKLIDINQSLLDRMGLVQEGYRGLNSLDFFAGDNYEELTQTVNLVRKGKEVKGVEFKAKTPQGEIYEYEINSVPIIEEGEVKKVLNIAHDITDRKKIERELIEINQLKTELLERTSHELKTPLISIKGFTDLLLDLHKEKFDNEILSILGEVKLGTEQLGIIINKLLETSLLDSGKIQFKPSEEDLSFLIRFCVKNFRGLAKTRNHFISLDIPNSMTLNFEKEKIYEVISHLVINAIKYSPPYGEIKIQTEKTNDFVIVSVQDHGIGLSEDEQKKIFKRFGKIERYGQGWDIGIEGTGMGLYTSKKIVELHGGEIWVESEGRNKGAKFYFTLPLNKD